MIMKDFSKKSTKKKVVWVLKWVGGWALIV